MIKQIYIPDPFLKVTRIIDHKTSEVYDVYPEQWLEIFYLLEPSLKDKENCEVWLSDVKNDDMCDVTLTVSVFDSSNNNVHAYCKKKVIDKVDICVSKRYMEILHRHPSRSIRINKEVMQNDWWTKAVHGGSDDDIYSRWDF